MFELLDRMSGPANKIAGALKKLDPALKTNAGGVSLFSRGIDFIGRSFGPKAAGATLRFADAAVKLGDRFSFLKPVIEGAGKAGALFGRGALAVGSAMLTVTAGAITAGTGLAVAGGKWAVDAIRFREDTLAGFKAMLGSQSAADGVMSQVQKFAAKTPFTTTEVVGMANSLLTRGFKANELEKLMLGVGDVGAMLGTDKMESVIGALGKMRSRGKLGGEAMEMLADAGVSTKLVYDALSKSLGKSRDEVEKLISAGKVTDAQGVSATLEAISQGLSGGKLGGAMEAKSKTLSGLVSTLASVPEDLIAAVNFDKFLQPLKDFVKQLTDALSPDTAVGQRFIAIFEQLGTTIGTVFVALGGGRDIETTIGGLLNVLEPLVKVFGAFVEGGMRGLGAVFTPLIDVFVMMGQQPDGIASFTRAMTELGEVVGFVAGAIVVGAGTMVGAVFAFVTALSKVGELMTGFWQAVLAIDWAELGINIIGGIIQGLFAMMGPLAAAAVGIGNTIKSALEGNLKIASPSQVFAELGQMTGLGFLQGLEGSGMADALTNPTIGSPAADGLAALTAAPGAGAPQITIQLTVENTIMVDGSGESGKKAARQTADSFGAALASELNGLGLSFGR